jgi:hypothetical protein
MQSKRIEAASEKSQHFKSAHFSQADERCGNHRGFWREPIQQLGLR